MSTPAVMIAAETFSRYPMRADNQVYKEYVVVARMTAQVIWRKEWTENESQFPGQQEKHQKKGHCKQLSSRQGHHTAG